MLTIRRAAGADLKIVVMGHGGVGKTTLIHRYIHNDFAETVSTLGASFVLKKWRKYYFGIWDTAGQERFTKISTFYCRGAQAAILAFDVTDRETFHALENYMHFLVDADKACQVVVVATKVDLIKSDAERRQVSEEEGRRYAGQYRAFYYETSAKDNIGVTAVFDRIGFQCLADRISDEEAPPPAAASPRSLHQQSSRPLPTDGEGALAGAAPRASPTKACCALQ